MKLILGVLLALVFHIILGWQWSPLAGVVVGWWSIRRGWLYGAAAVGASWALLLGYNYVVAGEAVTRFNTTMSNFVPGLPSWAIPATTVLIGVLLGLIGGYVGQTIGPLLGVRDNEVTPARLD